MPEDCKWGVMVSHTLMRLEWFVDLKKREKYIKNECIVDEKKKRQGQGTQEFKQFKKKDDSTSQWVRSRKFHADGMRRNA